MSLLLLFPNAPAPVTGVLAATLGAMTLAGTANVLDVRTATLYQTLGAMTLFGEATTEDGGCPPRRFRFAGPRRRRRHRPCPRTGNRATLARKGTR